MFRILIYLGLAALTAWAQTGERPRRPSITGESAAVSQYLWRGYVLNSSPSFQPAITLKYEGLTLSSWSNFSTRVSHNQCWTENDLTMEYARPAGRFTLSAGFLDYRFPELTPDEGHRTYEVSLGVAYSHYLNPSFKVYRDLSLGHGNYYFLGASHTYSLGKRMALTPSAGLGLNQHMYQRATTVSDADLGLTLDVPVGRKVTVSPTFLLMTGHRSLFGTHYAFGLKTSFTP